jgi:hypothetical protein
MSAASISTTDTIVVRRAVKADSTDLERLAVLDSARPLTGATLVAESDGVLRAALSLDDGRTIADPFIATQAHVALLRTHAATLRVRRRAGASFLRFRRTSLA